MLNQIGLVPDLVTPADIDETPEAKELPRPFAIRMATAKLDVVREKHPEAVVLAADTVVAVGRRILPKTETKAEARRCLELLSGRRHRVLGAIAVSYPKGQVSTRLVSTVVKFKSLHNSEIQSYLDGGEWQGKAGGYAIQGMAARFIPFISGSYTNVVGLSLPETANLLALFGRNRQTAKNS